jgi:hypothetical protein
MIQDVIMRETDGKLIRPPGLKPLSRASSTMPGRKRAAALAAHARKLAYAEKP